MHSIDIKPWSKEDLAAIRNLYLFSQIIYQMITAIVLTKYLSATRFKKGLGGVSLDLRYM